MTKAESDVLALSVCKVLTTANIPTAAVFRTIEMASPTLLIDEADPFLRHDEGLRGVITSGAVR
jgi:hypothetical protein